MRNMERHLDLPPRTKSPSNSSPLQKSGAASQNFHQQTKYMVRYALSTNEIRPASRLRRCFFFLSISGLRFNTMAACLLLRLEKEGTNGEALGIGEGWQLAWKWSEREGAYGKKEGGFKRIYLHEGVPASCRGSILSIQGGDIPETGEYVQAAALVSQPSLYSKDIVNQHPVGPAMVHPSEEAAKGFRWSDLCEPGVNRALVVGVGIQILWQFLGINGVVYYTPQILEQAGVGVLLANLGISSTSASILLISLVTLLMLPSIGIAMRFMDIAGRRFLLLATIPVLLLTLIILVLSNIINMGTVLHAVLSTDNLMRACAEQLTTLRETSGDNTVELPPEIVDTIFESLVVPNAKKRLYPVGNLEGMFLLPCSFPHLLNIQNVIALAMKMMFMSYKKLLRKCA